MVEIDIEKEKKAIAREYKELLRISYQKLSADDKKLIRKAFDVAVDAHQHQRRKSGEAYIFHPIAVAKIVASEIGLGATGIAAALLHDVVEDTAVTMEVVRKEFGTEVADLVGWLTDVSRPEHGNRAKRKELDRLHTAAAPAEAQTVKLADLISNTKSIMTHDEKFAKTYLEEKRLLLAMMHKGDRTLMAEAMKHIGV